MKRILSLFFILILVVSFAFAQLDGLDSAVNQLEQGRDKVDAVIDNPNEAARDYLTQEWTKILEKNDFGKFILGVGKIFESLSPVFELLIGIEYSLSWLFFLSLVFWIAIVIIIYQAVRSGLQFKWWIALGISIIIPAIAAQFDSFERFSNLWVPLLKNFWSVFILFLIIILLIAIYSVFMNNFGKALKFRNEKDTKSRIKEKEKLLEKIYDIELKGRGVK